MQVVGELRALEERAAALNRSLHYICKLADVDYTSVHDWKAGNRSPRVDNFQKTAAKLEAVVLQLERDMREKLTTDRQRQSA